MPGRKPKVSATRARIESFVENLRQKRKVSTNDYLVLVHNFVRGLCRNSKVPDPEVLLDPYRFVRVCKKCRNWRKESPLVECYQCEDVYHVKCVGKVHDDDWVCGQCEQVCRHKQRAQENATSNRLPRKKQVEFP